MGLRCKVEKVDYIWENSARLLYFSKAAQLEKVVFVLLDGEMHRLYPIRDAKNAFILNGNWDLPRQLEGVTLELIEEDDPIAKQPRLRTLERTCPK